jgi:hypothetical protein
MYSPLIVNEPHLSYVTGQQSELPISTLSLNVAQILHKTKKRTLPARRVVCIIWGVFFSFKGVLSPKTS